MRKIKNINENWRFIKSTANVEAAVGTAGEILDLPHTWNALDGQDGGNDYYRGTCWYVKELENIDATDKTVYLEFMGAGQIAEVFVNGTSCAKHQGGYSTFRVDITDYLGAENQIAVSVDNSSNDTVYPQKADFTFYGGLYRSVNVITVPKTHFALNYHGSSGIKVTPTINGENAEILVEAWITGPAMDVTFTIDDQDLTITPIDGYAKAKFTIEGVRLWDGLVDPYLYTATAILANGDKISTRFGCRSFRVCPKEGFFLNGRSYPLRGVSRHQDWEDIGNAISLEMQKSDIEIIREIGANTVRLAHYQHSQEFYDLCDELGLIIWAEIPYITKHMATGRANTINQMTELVVQNYNHPSIVCWGLSNEITAASVVDEDLLENHQILHDLCHKLDPSRITTIANVFMLEIDSPIIDIPDVNSYNLYFGWYLGELEQNDSFFDEFHAKYPNKAMGFSEYGADANPQFQSANPERGDYTESYQAVYHEHMINMINERSFLWATHLWNLFDFGADGRIEGGLAGKNQKGLVTFDRKVKKDAFYLYKAHWSTDPFVHLCGSRYIDRVEDMTEVKVYSNQSEVSLYVNGQLVETKKGQHVFKFEIANIGEQKLEAKSGNCTDSSIIRKVDAPNASYIFGDRETVVNWFDQDEFNPNNFSIKDTLGVLKSNPVSNAIMEKLMAAGRAARGDVAESVQGNPVLEKMMAGMTLESIIKQVGDAVSSEQVKAINEALQKIPK